MVSLILFLLFSDFSSTLVILAESQNETKLEYNLEADTLESEDYQVIEHSNVRYDDYLLDLSELENALTDKDISLVEKRSSYPSGVHVWDETNYSELSPNADESLAYDENGFYWLGNAIYDVSGGDGVLDPSLDFLLSNPFQVKENLDKTLFSHFSNRITSLFSTEEIHANSTPKIERVRTVQVGQTKVGEYRVNGKLAYCVEHNRDPATEAGTYSPLEPYNNARMLRLLYYGWGGEGNIFSSGQKDVGIAVTSLIASRIRNPGEQTGRSLARYEELWKLVNDNTKNPPSSKVELSEEKLNISIEDNRQVSEKTKFLAHSDNRIQISVPTNVRIINETRNTSSTGGTLTIRGGDTFYFTAPLSYNSTLKRTNIRGSIPTYTPMITYDNWGIRQPLAQMDVYDDPHNTVSFEVPFTRQEVDITILHRDRVTEDTIKTEIKPTLIGDPVTVAHNMTRYSWGNKYNGRTINLINDGGQAGTYNVTEAKTYTVWYTSQHRLKIELYDKFSGDLLETDHNSLYKAGASFSHQVPNNFDVGKTHYVLNRSAGRTVTGSMPREDRTIKVNYDPYHDATILWRNRFPAYDIFERRDDRIKVGDGYHYVQEEFYTLSGGRTYQRENNLTFSDRMGYADISNTFYYRLMRDVTVNYIDNRTGEPIRDSKVYTLLQADPYSEVPAVIEKGEYVYRYVRHDGDPESGIIGTSHLTINYYYDIPLIKTGLERIQIYTTPASEGLPVIVDLMKENNYAYPLQDMGEATVMVNLYKDDTLITGNRYTARALPEQLTLTIPPEALAVNETATYTVRLEDFNPDDIRVPADQAEVDTEGYTAEEGTLEAEVVESDVLRYEGVIKTERMIGEPMQVFTESFAIPLEPIRKMKTGYGFEMPLDLSYQNRLGNASVAFGFALTAPEALVDLSYIDYARQAGSVMVPLDRTGATTQANQTETSQQFALPAVQVEKETGHVFSSEQVANGDSRITHSLIDGGRKLYLPIWGYVGDYSVAVTTEVPIGIHLMSVNLTYPIEVVGHMYLHMDSETKEKDAIHMEPINQDNPFPLGVPDNWTAEEIADLQAFLARNN